MTKMYLKNWIGYKPTTLVQMFADKVVMSMFGLNHRHEYFLFRLYERYFKNKPIKVLDVGAGDGWALSYQNSLIEKHVLDIDEYCFHKLIKKGIITHNINIITQNPDCLIKSAGKFDLILMNHVIEHIDDIDKFIANIMKLLKKDGILYIRTPDIRKIKFDFFADYTHIRPFTMESLCQLLQTHTLAVISSGRISSGLLYIGAVFPDRLSLLLQNSFGKDLEVIATHNDESI